jgi:hypothetical protein
LIPIPFLAAALPKPGPITNMEIAGGRGAIFFPAGSVVSFQVTADGIYRRADFGCRKISETQSFYGGLCGLNSETNRIFTTIRETINPNAKL